MWFRNELPSLAEVSLYIIIVTWYTHIVRGPVKCNILCFYRKDLLKLRPTIKLEDHHLSAARDCLFSIFAANFLIGGRSSICNLRTRHVEDTQTNLSHTYIPTYLFIPLSLLCYYHYHCYFHIPRSFSVISLSTNLPNLNPKLPV